MKNSTSLRRNLLPLALAASALPGVAFADEIQLSSSTSKCIHKQNSDANNGNPIHLWDCNVGYDNRSWTYESSTGYIRLAADTSKCLHKKDSNWNNGNAIHLWDCSAGPEANKSWDLDASTGYIKARHNTAKCIHKKYSNTDNGNPIHLWDCSAGPSSNKSWTFADQGVSVDTTIAGQCTGSNAVDATVFQADDSFGNSTFGAGYNIEAGVVDEEYYVNELGLPASMVPDDLVLALGAASAYATVFSTTRDILSIAGSVTHGNDTDDSLLMVEVLGATVYSEEIGVSAGWDTDVTFFEASGVFYGVTVTGELVGTIGADASASLTTSGLAMEVTPFAGVSANATASVGGLCIEAGVGAEITIISIEVPVEAQVAYSGSDIGWSIEGDLDLSTVDGNLYLYIDYCFDSATKTIFSWDGYSTSFDLFAASGCI